MLGSTKTTIAAAAAPSAVTPAAPRLLPLSCSSPQQPNHCLQDGVIYLDDEAVGGLVKHIRREARVNPLLVHTMLLDCAVQLSTKVPIYALLVGKWWHRNNNA